MKPYSSDTDSKTGQVRRMFDRIAPRYDLLNHLLSLGVDRRWRRKAVRDVARTIPSQVLDVATGTGDMALVLARAIPSAAICGMDLSPEMLAVGRDKATRKGLSERVTFSEGDVTALQFPDGHFDAVTVAFGVRNFEQLEVGIREMRRVLRPGGRIAVLEFSVPKGKLFSALYRFYFHRLLPWAGGLISGDGEAYRYLPLSVDEFPSPERFVEMLCEAGFTDCSARALTGGVAYLYTANAN